MDFNMDNLPFELIPKTRYYFSLCNLCYKYVENMKTCSQCKSVVYCCKNHQVRDWKNHKSICKAIAVTKSKLDNVEVKNFKEFRKLQTLRSLMWQHFLNRKLIHHEAEMWMYPKVCAVCYSNDPPLVCQDCLNVAYCSVKHQEKHKTLHKQHCHLLKFGMEYETKLNPVKKEVVLGPFDDNVLMLPDCLEELLKLSDKSNDICRRGALSFSAAATILYGLEKAGLVINRSYKKKDLIVHIVGANETEKNFLWKIMCELPFHWLKNLGSIHYIIIGPELNSTENTDRFTKELCERCKVKNVVTQCTFKTDLYNIKDISKEPDLIVCFNSGIHEHSLEDEDPWRDSLKFLTRNINTPLLLTAYNMEEIIADVSRAKVDAMVEEVLAPQINPFHSPYPLREFDIENEAVYYCSGWMSILMRKQPCQ